MHINIYIYTYIYIYIHMTCAQIHRSKMSFFDALGPGSLRPGSQREDLELMASTMEAGRNWSRQSACFLGQIPSGNDGFNMV